MKKRTSVVWIMFLFLAASAALKLQNDRLPRKRIPGSSIIYIPSGKYLKMASFGYSSLAADLVFLWAIQYYGNPAIPDKFAYFTHIFSIISELDPRYVDPYEVGALIAMYDANDMALAYKILDMGAAKNPDMWIFPFQAGHYAMLRKDFDTAKAYFEKTMAIPGAPAITKRLYANASFKTLDYQTAWDTWKDVYETAKDEQIRKIASNHLYQVKAAVDIAALKNAVFDFRARFGRNPMTLDQLVRAGLLRQVPRDFDEKDYVYNPQTGAVTTAVNPWKR
jgi:tetratricopeptide (TPR) repeat protein